METKEVLNTKEEMIKDLNISRDVITDANIFVRNHKAVLLLAVDTILDKVKVIAVLYSSKKKCVVDVVGFKYRVSEVYKVENEIREFLGADVKEMDKINNTFNKSCAFNFENGCIFFTGEDGNSKERACDLGWDFDTTQIGKDKLFRITTYAVRKVKTIINEAKENGTEIIEKAIDGKEYLCIDKKTFEKIATLGCSTKTLLSELADTGEIYSRAESGKRRCSYRMRTKNNRSELLCVSKEVFK